MNGKTVYWLLGAIFTAMIGMGGLIWHDQRAQIAAQAAEIVWIKRYILEKEQLAAQRLERMNQAIARLSWAMAQLRAPGYEVPREAPEALEDPSR